MLSGLKLISLNFDGNYNSNGLKKKRGGGICISMYDI